MEDSGWLMLGLTRVKLVIPDSVTVESAEIAVVVEDTRVLVMTTTERDSEEDAGAMDV